MRNVKKEKFIVSLVIIGVTLLIIFGIVVVGLVNIGKAISTF